jgi:hypothetical protein
MNKQMYVSPTVGVCRIDLEGWIAGTTIKATMADTAANWKSDENLGDNHTNSSGGDIYIPW